jgi:probable HAF family extracellular repeat protein
MDINSKIMAQSFTHSLRGPRIVKTSRGIISMAAVIGAAVLLVPMSAAAQDTTPLDCLPGSTGPTSGDATPYGGGMCDLDTQRAGYDGWSRAKAVSADGAVAIGELQNENNQARAFRWDSVSGAIRDLGTLRSDNFGYSYAKAVSADGAVVVGESETDDSRRAFRWDTDTGVMRDLGTLRSNNLGRSSALAVSADGAVVVGGAETDNSESHAFRWDSVSGAMRDLGTLRSDNFGFSQASAVSADGAVVVGRADTDDDRHAFRWDTGTGVMRDLGTLRSDNSGGSYAYAMSADGAVVVGEADTDDGSRAYRWDSVSGAMRDLGTLRSGNEGYSTASAVSADGAVVVGSSTTGDDDRRAFRWDTVSEEMRDLGTLRSDNFGFSHASAVSADGAVVVGSATTGDDDRRAFRWDTVSEEMRDLGSLRSDNFGGSYASAVSADGAVVVGYADTDVPGFGGNRAFIWRTQMQDLENLMLSFPAPANDTAIAVAQQQGTVGQLASWTCLAETGASCMRTSLISSNTGSTASDDIGSSSSPTGLISYGYGVSDGWTLGGTLSLGSTSLNHNGFEMGSNLGAALRGSYSEGHSARTGWQGEVALGYGRASGDIIRGRGLDNVLLSTGQADMDTRLARASLGYGINQAQGWLLTPTLGITNTRTTRGAYTETGGDFNASYDSLSIDRTSMDLSLSAGTAINDVSRLTLTGGLERDLNADRAVLTGTSDMPGMETFTIGSALDRRDTRRFFATEYAYDISETQTLSGSLKVGQTVYGSKPQVGLGISFDMKF